MAAMTRELEDGWDKPRSLSFTCPAPQCKQDYCVAGLPPSMWTSVWADFYPVAQGSKCKHFRHQGRSYNIFYDGALRVNRLKGKVYCPTTWLTRSKSESFWPWPGCSVGKSIIPICQGYRFDFWSEHTWKATNEFINKNNSLAHMASG